MTKKKRELIEILLDNVKPEDWPEIFPYAAQDKSCSMVYVYANIPYISSIYGDRWECGEFSFNGINIQVELCKFWNKTIVHRDEFMKRWNERNQVDDSEGWIQWNGGEMPVEKGTLIDVKYRDGLINLHVIAGFGGCSTGSIKHKCAINFNHYGRSVDIIAYRLHVPQEQKTPQQLALEKFGTDWHENDGVQPVDDKVLIDAIVHGGALMRKYTWSALGLFKIKKWRVHSDEKESQATEKEKKLEWLSQPMPLFGEEIPCHFVDAKSPLETQIGGDHYTKLAIQPMRYSMENGLDPLQHTIIKYVTRFRDKAGIEDLEKAKHCIDMLIEFERGKK